MAELKELKVEAFNGRNFLKSKQSMLKAARSVNLREVAAMIDGTFQTPGAILARLHVQRTVIQTFVDEAEPYVAYIEQLNRVVSRFREEFPFPATRDPVVLDEYRLKEGEALNRSLLRPVDEPSISLDEILASGELEDMDFALPELEAKRKKDYKFQVGLAKSYIFQLETQIRSAHGAVEAHKLRIQHQCNTFFAMCLDVPNGWVTHAVRQTIEMKSALKASVAKMREKNLVGHFLKLLHDESVGVQSKAERLLFKAKWASFDAGEVPLAEFKNQLFEYLDELRAMDFEPPADQLVVTIATQILQHYHWDPIRQYVGAMLSDESDPGHIRLPDSVGELFIGLEGKIEHWIRQQLASGNSTVAHNTNLSYKRSPQASASDRVSITLSQNKHESGNLRAHRECDFCGKTGHTTGFCHSLPQEIRNAIRDAKKKLFPNGTGAKAAQINQVAASAAPAAGKTEPAKSAVKQPPSGPSVSFTDSTSTGARKTPTSKRAKGKKPTGRASLTLNDPEPSAEDVEDALLRYMLSVNMLAVHKLQDPDLVLIDEGANIAVVPDASLLVAVSPTAGKLSGFAEGITAKTTGYGQIPFMGRAAIVPNATYIVPKDSLEQQGWFLRPIYEGTITVGYTAEREGVSFKCTKDRSQRLIFARLQDLKRAIQESRDQEALVVSAYTRGQARRQASEPSSPGRTLPQEPEAELDIPERPATGPGSPFQGRADDDADPPSSLLSSLPTPHSTIADGATPSQLNTQDGPTTMEPVTVPAAPTILLPATLPDLEPPALPQAATETARIPIEPDVRQPLPSNSPTRPILFTIHEQQRALEVVYLHRALNHMPYDQIKTLLGRGSILNCRLLPADVDNAVKIHKHCPHCLAGRMRQPAATTWDIPAGARPGQYWEADLLFAHRDATKNKFPIAIFVDCVTGYTLCYVMMSKAKSSFIAVGKKFATFLREHCYQEQPSYFVRTDREYNFNDLCIQVPGCKLCPAPNGMKAYFAERKIGVIKEAFSAKRCELKYPLPGLLHPPLIRHIVQTGNYAPSSRLQGLTPTEALLGTKVELAHILRWNFGTVVYARKPRDSNAAVDPTALPERGDLGIVIDFERNTPSNVKVLLLHNSEVVSRARIEPTPVDATICEQIKRLGGDGSQDALSGPVTEQELRSSATGALFDDPEGVTNPSLEDPSASAIFYDEDPTPQYFACAISSEMIDESNMSIPEATVLFGREAVLQSVAAELKMTIDQHKIYNWVRPEHVAIDAHVIPSKDFIRAKYAGGKFNKLKTRTAAGGHRQRPGSFTQTSSPTVDFHNALLISSIAKHYRGKLRTTDFPSAYLNAKVTEKIVMIFTKPMSEIIVELYPHLKEYLGGDGRLRAYLVKALYGLKQAGALWYKMLVKALLELGLNQSTTDACVFYKRDGDKIIVLCFHVDDMLTMCNHDPWFVTIAEALNKTFGPLQWSEQLFEYLGARFKQNSDHSVDVDMEFATRRFMDRRKVTGGSKHPSNMDLFSKLDMPGSFESRAIDFKSQLYELMFLTRVRFDIVKECCFLATLSDNPGDEAYLKLHKLQAYLNSTADKYLHLASSSLDVHIYGDAAHAVHEDYRSHTGLCVYIGDPSLTGAILAKSFKQKIFAKSSHESEVAAAVDSVKPGIAAAKLVSELGGIPLKAWLWQDNEAGIKTLFAGEGVHPRTRHYLIRWHFIHFMVEKGILEIKYVSTDAMKADYLTKPQGGAKALNGINGLGLFQPKADAREG